MITAAYQSGKNKFCKTAFVTMLFGGVSGLSMFSNYNRVCRGAGSAADLGVDCPLVGEAACSPRLPVEGPPERGAALIELAIVVPLLALLLFGVFSLGRAISQLAWVSQSSYAAVVAGGESVGAIVQTQSNSTFSALFDVLNSSNGRQLRGAGGGSGVASSLDQANRLVKVSVDVETSPIGGFWSLPVKLDTVGPLLTSERLPGNLSTFENASPCANGAPLQLPCGRCSCPSSSPKPPPVLGPMVGIPGVDVAPLNTASWASYLTSNAIDSGND